MIRTDLEMTLVILILLPIFSLSVYKVSGIVGKKSKLQLKEEQFCSFFDKIGKEKEKRDEDAN